MKRKCSPVTSVLTRARRRNIPEEDILHRCSCFCVVLSPGSYPAVIPPQTRRRWFLLWARLETLWFNVPTEVRTGISTFERRCQNRTDGPISPRPCILFAQRSAPPTREHVPHGLAVLFPFSPYFSVFLSHCQTVSILECDK
jgi:hypothetical protein